MSNSKDSDIQARNNIENHKIESKSEEAELASLWGQHEICPECRGNRIKEIDERVRVFIFHSYHVKRYICTDCGCKWL